jgi:hypothetical protein
MHVLKRLVGILAGIVAVMAAVVAPKPASAQDFIILNCLDRDIVYQAGPYVQPRNQGIVNWQNYTLPRGQQHVWPISNIPRDAAYGLHFAWRHPAFIDSRGDQNGIIYAFFGPPTLNGPSRANLFLNGVQIWRDTSGKPQC